jgi:alanine racemase
MTLRSRLIAVQQLQPGDTVGYGSSFTASAACASASWPAVMPTATRATAGTGTPVLVDGVRTGTVGRVSMDMLAVDLTPVPGAAGQRGHAVGPRPAGQRCWPSTTWRAPPAPSATS